MAVSPEGKRQAMCGANVADVVGSMAIFVASVIQARSWPVPATDVFVPTALDLFLYSSMLDKTVMLWCH